MNTIGDEGASSLAKALQVSKNIIKIDLEYNEIGAIGASSLTRALAVNKNITTLNLEKNQVRQLLLNKIEKQLNKTREDH